MKKTLSIISLLAVLNISLSAATLVTNPLGNISTNFKSLTDSLRDSGVYKESNLLTNNLTAEQKTYTYGSSYAVNNPLLYKNVPTTNYTNSTNTGTTSIVNATKMTTQVTGNKSTQAFRKVNLATIQKGSIIEKMPANPYKDKPTELKSPVKYLSSGQTGGTTPTSYTNSIVNAKYNYSFNYY